jgi:hypothetical protein
MFDLIPPLLVYLLVFGGLGALLSLPAFLRGGGRAGAVATAKVTLLLIVPVVVFVLSVMMVPDWKGAALAGWLDGFHLGKLALSPLVLWGVVAAWAHEVLAPPPAPRRWVGLGYLAGALAAGISTGVGFFIVGRDMPVMVVPVVTTAYFVLRAAQLWRAQAPAPGPLAALGLSTAGLLAAALVQSQRVYAELPDHPPDCFVVTAASQGHPAVVGRRAPVLRGGRLRWANAQLRELWAFEDRLAARWPALHAALRRIYDRVGPPVARQVRGPWAADLMFLALWPAQVVLRRALRG